MELLYKAGLQQARADALQLKSQSFPSVDDNTAVYSLRFFYSESGSKYSNYMVYNHFAPLKREGSSDDVKFRFPLGDLKDGEVSLSDCIAKEINFDINNENGEDHSGEFTLADLFKDTDGTATVDIEDNAVVVNGGVLSTSPFTTVICKTNPSENFDVEFYDEIKKRTEAKVTGSSDLYFPWLIATAKVDTLGFRDLFVERLNVEKEIRVVFKDLTKLIDGSFKITLPQPAFLAGAEKLVYSSGSVECTLTLTPKDGSEDEVHTLEASYVTNLFKTEIKFSYVSITPETETDGYSSASIQCPIDIEFSYNGFADIGEIEYTPSAQKNQLQAGEVESFGLALNDEATDDTTTDDTTTDTTTDDTTTDTTTDDTTTDDTTTDTTTDDTTTDTTTDDTTTDTTTDDTTTDESTETSGVSAAMIASTSVVVLSAMCAYLF